MTVKDVDVRRRRIHACRRWVIGWKNGYPVSLSAQAAYQLPIDDREAAEMTDIPVEEDSH
jgi:hypothetical protein